MAASSCSWLPAGMDPNSSYLLKIKLFGNPKCVRKEISYFCFEKVVDSDTTNFKDFVDEIVDKFPPGFNDVATVQYYDDDAKLFPQVKTDQELQAMFVKHAETKVVNMCVAYAETPHLISQWPISPLKKGDISAAAVSSIPTNEIDQQPDNDLDDDAYLMNPLPENEFVGVDEEGMYLGGKKAVAANDDNVPEEDFDSCSESEFEEELKDSVPDHIQYANYNKEDPPMTVGTVYRSIAEFKLALAQHAIKNEFEYNTEKSEPGRFRGYCSRKEEDNCPWRIHASTIEDEVSVMVRKNPYAHDCTSTRRKQTVKNASKYWVSEKVKDWLIEDATLGAKELQRRIKDKFKVLVHYKRVYMGKDLALNQLYGDWDSSFDNLYRFKAEIDKACPGSFVVIDHHTINGKIRFRRLFFALKPIVDGFLRGCRPYLAVDSTFLTGRFKGQLATACGVDGHNWMYPVAFGVFDSETNENWIWFMGRLIEAIGSPRGLVICTDAGQAVMTGVKEVFPEVEHRECMWHLVNNFKKRYHGKVFDDHLWAAAYSWHPHFFEKHWAEMESAKAAATEYIRERHTRLWSRSQFSTICKVDYVTNNLAESFNNWIKDHKVLNLDDFMDKIRQLIAVKWNKRRKVSMKFEGLILPHIIKRLKEKSRDLDLEVVAFSNDVGEVTVLGGSGFRFVVNLNDKTCLCREWQVCGIPCIHAIAFITTQDQAPLENYVDLYYSVQTFRAAYAPLIPAIQDKSQWPKASHGFFMHPPLLKATAGRRRNERYKGCTEGKGNIAKKKRQHKCPICKDFGHHWPSCKKGDPDDIAAIMAKRGPPKKRKKISQACIEQSLVCFDDQALSQSMNFPPRSASGSNEPDTLCIEYPISTSVAAATKPKGKKNIGERKAKGKKNVGDKKPKGKDKSKAEAKIFSPQELHLSPAMGTRSKKLEPPNPAFSTRSKRRFSL